MEIKCEQRSDEWFAARLGLLTCSQFPKLMPMARQKPDDWNETQLSILREVAAERLTGKHEESYTSSAMQWGIDNEDMARYTFEAETMETVRKCGFFKSDVSPDFIGGSPDGIIVRDGEDWGVAEFKCPTSKQHLRYLLDKEELWNDYKWQVLGHCFVSHIKHYALVSYDPRFDETKQLVVIARELEFNELDPLRYRLGLAVDIIKGWI